MRTTAGMQEVEQRRSSCRGAAGSGSHKAQEIATSTSLLQGLAQSLRGAPPTARFWTKIRLYEHDSGNVDYLSVLR